MTDPASAAPMPAGPRTNHRRLAMQVLCIGMLMIQIDTTVVNVALPSIKLQLGFTSAFLAWVVNIYMLTFGGSLLLAGRLGDLYGHRRLFLWGMGLFTLASLGCGLATDAVVLVSLRALQGIGGAAVTSMGMSLLVDLYPEPGERAKAMGVYGFVGAIGGSVGLMLGGILTRLLGWPSIFFVNVPLGLVAIALAFKVLPARRHRSHVRLDVAGAVTVTAGLMLSMYVITRAPLVGLASVQTLGLLAVALLLLLSFLLIQLRSPAPLVPLRLFRLRSLSIASGGMVLWGSSIYAWFILFALYLQNALHMNPLQVGLAFLPTPVLGALFSLGLAARLINRFGMRKPIIVGFGLSVVSYLLFARAPADGSFPLDVLPGMILLGLSVGMLFTPLMFAAIGEVAPEESGLASGIVNTALMMGGAVGIAVLATLASYHGQQLAAAGMPTAQAEVGGQRLAYLICALLSLLGMVLGALLRRPAAGAAAQASAPPPMHS